MNQILLHVDQAPQELHAGLLALLAEFPTRFSTSSTGDLISFEPRIDGPSLQVDQNDRGIGIRYRSKADAFRALGSLAGGATAPFNETARFDMRGVMIDVSRNAVLRPDVTRSLMCRFALMGINVLMLYSEDTYEIPGEPFFGYLRGRYNHEEMKSLDDFADAMGIEMFPCIQTLGHLEQILQWPAYAPLEDVHGVLLAEEEDTYALISKMIRASSSPFRSKRIHIGMDEAHGVGTGNYRKKHGEKRLFDVLNAHLNRVRSMCNELGLRPMIWSDMYFRLGSTTNDYYDTNSKIPQDVVDQIPKDIQLVYWDYYHLDQKFFEDSIQRHRALGSEPLVATGAWTWGRFWCSMPFARLTTEACMNACKAQGLREVFTTMWGDDGNECDIFSALGALQYFAEHAYHDQVSEDRVKQNFWGSCNADLDDWALAAQIDAVPEALKTRRHLTAKNSAFTTSKVILWQDPLLAIFDPQLDITSLRAHYEKLAETLESAATKSQTSSRLRFPALIAKAASYKCELRQALEDAYTAGNRNKLKQILEQDLVPLIDVVKQLWHCHRDLWLSTYKPFGLEVIEKRYGGLIARLESLDYRLTSYIKGSIDEIPELAAQLVPIAENWPYAHYARASTPSMIK